MSPRTLYTLGRELTSSLLPGLPPQRLQGGRPVGAHRLHFNPSQLKCNPWSPSWTSLLYALVHHRVNFNQGRQNNVFSLGGLDSANPPYTRLLHVNYKPKLGLWNSGILIALKENLSHSCPTPHPQPLPLIPDTIQGRDLL